MHIDEKIKRSGAEGVLARPATLSHALMNTECGRRREGHYEVFRRRKRTGGGRVSGVIFNFLRVIVPLFVMT